MPRYKGRLYVPPLRHWFDIAVINDSSYYPIDIKITEMRAASSLVPLIYALTNTELKYDKHYDSTSLLKYFNKDMISDDNNRDYYYLVINKKNTKDIIITSIKNLSKITFKDGLDISGMFEDCENLINVDLKNLDYTTIEHAENMFKNCKHLNTIRMDNLVASVDPSIFHDFLYNTGFYLYDDKFGNPVRCVEIVININTALALFPENEIIHNIAATGDNNVRLYINNETILAAMGDDESGYTSVADNILAQVAYSSIDPSSAKHCFIKLMCSSSDYDVAVQSELLRDDIYSDIIDNDFDGDAYLFLEFTNLSVIRIPFTNLSESTIPFVKIQFQSKDDSAGVNIQMDVTCEELF